MDTRINKSADEGLLKAVLAFVEEHPHPDLGRFRESITAWGQDWSGVAPAHLPVSDLLEPALAQTVTETKGLLALIAQERVSRKWEQTYTRADRAVGEDMLARYGYAEIIGKQGPFLSTRGRAGVGVWGPRVDYPRHHHRAEEVYVILAGRGTFSMGEAEPLIHEAGDVIFVQSQLIHGIRTTDDPLIVFYVWEGGDMREKSTFD